MLPKRPQYRPFLTGAIAAFMIAGWFAAPAFSQGRESSAMRGNFSQTFRFLRGIESDKGYLFIDGTYIEAPYQIEFQTDGFSVNGKNYLAEDFNLQADEVRNPQHRRRPGIRGGRSQESALQTTLSTLASQLQMLRSGVVVLLAKNASPTFTPPGIASYELIELLASDDPDSLNNLAFGGLIHSEMNREAWRQAVSGLQISTAFLEHARIQIAEHHALILSNQQQVTANQWTARLQYPLTIFAFFLVVAALGHLMTNAEQMIAGVNLSTVASDGLPTIKRTTIVLLTILSLMSLLDLVWTLLAHQSGTMRELNPLGNELVHSPVQLFLFKTMATGTAVGLLYWLRETPLARRATWWSCLILTLLTARWLTFNSMFA